MLLNFTLLHNKYYLVSAPHNIFFPKLQAFSNIFLKVLPDSAHCVMNSQCHLCFAVVIIVISCGFLYCCCLFYGNIPFLGPNSILFPFSIKKDPKFRSLQLMFVYMDLGVGAGTQIAYWESTLIPD